MHRRDITFVFLILGPQFGTIISLILSGFLADSEILGGWPSVFYIFGGLGLLLALLWFLLIRDNPTQHPRISKQELDYILKGIPEAGAKKVTLLLIAWKLTIIMAI